MAITGIPPNGWGGGYGAPPPPAHHANIHFLEALRSGPYPGCTPALVQMVLGNGSCLAISQGPPSSTNPGTPIPHGSYTQEPPNGWGTGIYLVQTSVGQYGQTPAGSAIVNSWGNCQDWSIEFQMRDANGNGVEIDTPAMTAGPGPGAQSLQPLAWNSLPQYLSISTNSNTIPNTPTSFIYTYDLPWPYHASQVFPNHTVPIQDQRFNYLLDHGNYTFEIFNLQCGCYHTSQNQTPNPQFHSIPLGPGGPVGSGLLPFTVPAAAGCGPQLPAKWLCHGDYHCREIGVQGGISDYDAMWNIWNMGKNMWGVGGNFGWTESTIQSPPNGATHVESDQSVDLTRPGEILDGLQPFTINNIPNPNITLSQYINVLPVNIGVAISDMPATPVFNTWTTVQNVPGGGATMYNLLGQNHPQASLWNPPPNTPPGPTVVGGYTSYRGVVIPPIGATTTTSLDNTFHGTPTWIPFHDSLSSCIACCGDVAHQFDENLQINPYYGPYMTPPGWNDPNLNTPSNNVGFEAWLNGTNPWNIVLPRDGGQVSIYKFYNGANMCGGTWIW